MLNRIISFIHFYWKAVNQYRLHSPIHVSFYKKVLSDERMFYCFGLVERLRTVLKDDERKINIATIGQPSKYGDKISIRKLATKVSSSPTKCRMLFRMVQWYQPDEMIELGTSLGLASIHIAHAKLSSPLITIEANHKIAAIAENNFKNTHSDNISLIRGTFEDNLPEVVKGLHGDSLFIYLDGNHASIPLLSYVEMILTNSAHSEVLICVDDINWSKDMQRAWKKLCLDDRFQYKIDLYQMGVLIKTKKHTQSAPVSMIPFRYKPILW